MWAVVPFNCIIEQLEIYFNINFEETEIQEEFSYEKSLKKQLQFLENRI